MNSNRYGSTAIFSRVWVSIALAALAVSAGVRADDTPVGMLRGDYIVSLHGSFKAPLPPFTGDAVKLDAAILGKYHLSTDGWVDGEQLLTFSNAALPMGVVSRQEISGSYSHSPGGLLVLYLEEDRIEPGSGSDGVTDNRSVLECYLVHRVMRASCSLHSLVTFQQGGEPQPLPVTMSGSLERQH